MATRAHTVPEFYLRGFVEGSPPSGQVPSLWIFNFEQHAAFRRSPRNVSVKRGAYDHPGGLPPGRGTIEEYLAKEVEDPAARALRVWLSRPVGRRGPVPPEVTRFVAWLAARTAPVMDLYPKWLEELVRREGMPADPDGLPLLVSVEMPDGSERSATSPEDVTALVRDGGRLRFERQHIVQFVHMQAWIFQTRLFPRLLWSIASAQPGDDFVTSDRPVFWGAWGLETAASPGWIKNESVQVFVPLARSVALVGAHGTIGPVSTEQVNALVARHATEWIAGPTRECVEGAAALR